MTAATLTAYKRVRKELLADESILPENRLLFKEWFDYYERRLKRKNSLQQLDAGAIKTLLKYTQMLRNIDSWFKKPLTKITKNDIKKVYDDLEDGIIVNRYGKPLKSRNEYYSKMFKSKLFSLAGGKDILAKEVIEYSSKKDEEVRFITQEDFEKLLAATNTIQHKTLLWLAWDYGENINTLLRLKKSDFERRMDVNNEPEYLLHFRRDILKRSRRQRGEVTVHPETVQFLDLHLKDLAANDLLFTFGYPYAKKIMNRIVKRTDVVAKPSGEIASWKDIRSGMVCHLLKEGWTTDQLNARLGHSPASQEIRKYVNFLALDTTKPKKQHREFQVKELSEKLNKQSLQLKQQNDEILDLKEKMNMLLSAYKLDKLPVSKVPNNK